MYVTNESPDRAEVKYLHDFAQSYHVECYIRSDPPFGLSTINYYICIHDGIRGLYSNKGDFLYDIGSLDPEFVLRRIEERSYGNWRQHGKAKTLPKQSTPLLTRSWSRECIEQYNNNIVLYLTKGHPTRTYGECEFVMKNEGYRITASGSLEPIEGMKQL